MTIEFIATTLAQLAERLEKGELHAHEIERMTHLSQQLYERLVVLRFKAYEEVVNTQNSSHSEEGGAVANGGDATSQPYRQSTGETQHLAEPEAVMEEKPKQEKKAPEEEKIPAKAEKTEEKEHTVFRFDTSEPVKKTKQISLIDSIEEIKKMEKSLNDSFADKPASLADKLNKTSVSNLKSAITVNQKFKFISDLFDNDSKAFEAAIDQINACSSFIEADEYIQNQLLPRYDWEKHHPTLKEMMTLVERRFL